MKRTRAALATTEPQVIAPLRTPPGVLEARDEILAAAGFTPELVKGAVDVLRDGQSATKVTYFAKDGVVMDQREDVDHNTRIRAAEHTLTLANAYPSRSASGAGGKVEVNVLIADWMPKRPA